MENPPVESRRAIDLPSRWASRLAPDEMHLALDVGDQPEPVLPPEQWNAIKAIIAQPFSRRI